MNGMTNEINKKKRNYRRREKGSICSVCLDYLRTNNVLSSISSSSSCAPKRGSCIELGSVINVYRFG